VPGTPPGFYPDSEGTTRWWDGEQRTQRVAPNAPALPVEQVSSGRQVDPLGQRERKRSTGRQAREEARQAKQDTEQREQAEREFRNSPVGRATTAYEQGAGFFQIELEVSEVARSFLASNYQGYSVRRREGPGHADALSEIESVGWHLAHVGFVYVMTGQVSRDKILSSGQEVGVMGKTMGIYLFRRVDTFSRVPD